MRNVLLAAMATLACYGIAEAKMYKCTDPNGKVTYSERPCAQGTQKAIKLHDNSSAPPAPSERTESNASNRQGIAGTSSRSRAGAQSGGSSTGIGTSFTARKGMSSDEVRANLGEPDVKDDPTFFGGNRQCPDGGMRQVWMYEGHNGNLGQKVTICSSRVVDVETISPGSKLTAGAGSNKFGHTGGSVTAQRGWSRMKVLEEMGQPDHKLPLRFSGSSLCPENQRVDDFVYLPRNGNLGQTVTFCNDSVVNVKHN